MSSLAHFSGVNADFSQWDHKFTEFVINMTDIRPWGVAASVFDGAKLNAIVPEDAQIDAFPREPVFNNNAAELYRMEMKDFRDYNKCVLSLRGLLIDAMPTEAREEICHRPDSQTMTVRHIYNFLVDKYGTLTTTDVDAEMEKLHAEHPEGTDINEIIAEHKRIHDVFVAANLPRLDYDKLRAFRLATANLSAFDRVWANFFDDFPKLSEQKFDTLVKRCRDAKNNGLTKPARPNPYAAPATQVPIPSCLPAQQLPQKSQQNSKSNGSRQNGRSSHFSNSGHSGTYNRPKPAEYAHCPCYCFIHGYGNHPSNECNTLKGMDEKFQQATAENHMGGSTKIAQRRA
jgi:hypothetical protein